MVDSPVRLRALSHVTHTPGVPEPLWEEPRTQTLVSETLCDVCSFYLNCFMPLCAFDTDEMRAAFIGCCHLDWNKEKKTSVHQINISFFAVGQDAFLKTHLCLNAKKQDDGQISNVLSWKREIWSKRVLLQRPLAMWLLLRKIRTVKLERQEFRLLSDFNTGVLHTQYTMNTTHYEVTSPRCGSCLLFCCPVIISEIKVI